MVGAAVTLNVSGKLANYLHLACQAASTASAMGAVSFPNRPGAVYPRRR